MRHSYRHGISLPSATFPSGFLFKLFQDLFLNIYPGVAERSGHPGFPDRPAGLGLQALPQHRAGQRRGQARRHARVREGKGQHRPLQVCLDLFKVSRIICFKSDIYLPSPG